MLIFCWQTWWEEDWTEAWNGLKTSPNPSRLQAQWSFHRLNPERTPIASVIKLWLQTDDKHLWEKCFRLTLVLPYNWQLRTVELDRFQQKAPFKEVTYCFLSVSKSPLLFFLKADCKKRSEINFKLSETNDFTGPWNKSLTQRGSNLGTAVTLIVEARNEGKDRTKF